ncbi:MAG: TRAP transporter permease [Bacteroidota bacterium]
MQPETQDPGGPVLSAFRRLLEAGLVAYALFHLITSIAPPLEPLQQRAIFISCGLALVYFSTALAAARTSGLRTALDIALGAAALLGGLNILLEANRLMDVMNDLTTLDITLGVVTILVALEAARRSVGLSLPLMAVISLAYYFWGHDLLGGSWQPPKVSLDTAISTLYGSTQGMFGLLADIGTRVVAIYVVLGSLLMTLGAGDVFMRAATVIAGRTYGGPAKVAVVTSALFGTISGSAVANVMSVGTITIPTMVRAGYRKDFAGGIEASASAGGQIMPPVMGAGAFIMAELLNIPYASVALAAAIPAILYFSAIYFSIDCYARGHGLKPMPREDLPRARDVFLSRDAIVAFGPLLLLAWLLFDDYTPTLAGAAATIALIVIAAVVRVVGCITGGASFAAEARAFGTAVWTGFVDGAKGVVAIAALLAAAALLVTVLTASGIGVKFSQLLLGLTGESLIVVLLITAVLCIMLGMDVPTTASYLLTASVAAAVLIKLGLAPLTAHLFIFYFAILSAITPPVCASVYAAASIVNENFWSVAGQALRIAGAVFFIPFMMVYRPELLLNGEPQWIVYHVAITWAAIVAMSGGAIGYLLGPLGWPGRLYLFAAAGILFYPTFWADGIGVVMILGFLGWRWLVPAHSQSAAPT